MQYGYRFLTESIFPSVGLSVAMALLDIFCRKQLTQLNVHNKKSKLNLCACAVIFLRVHTMMQNITDSCSKFTEQLIHLI